MPSKSQLTFLWSVPRSVSTAFEKMMAESQGFKVYGEPFIDLYKEGMKSPAGFISAKQQFQLICRSLIEESQTRQVFVKDMGYHALPFISDAIIHRINHTFLIRDPARSIPSLYKMRAAFNEPETGFEGLYKLFTKVTEATAKTPYVLDGDLLTQMPDLVVSDYFSWLGIDMPKGILSWTPGSRDDWTERESWHLDAIHSRRFEHNHRPIDLSGLPDWVLDSIERNTSVYKDMYQYIPVHIRDD